MADIVEKGGFAPSQSSMPARRRDRAHRSNRSADCSGLLVRRPRRFASISRIKPPKVIMEAVNHGATVRFESARNRLSASILRPLHVATVLGLNHDPNTDRDVWWNHHARAIGKSGWLV